MTINWVLQHDEYVYYYSSESDKTNYNALGIKSKPHTLQTSNTSCNTHGVIWYFDEYIDYDLHM